MKLRWQALAGTFLCVQLGSGWAAPALSQLHSFGWGDTAAANPGAEVLQGRDGALYGTTPLGGSAGQGGVYRLSPDGSGFRLLKSFGTNPADGTRPIAALLEGSDGALYGSTDEGGTFGFGTLFRLSEDGSSCTVLWNFTGAADGGYPEARLLEASDGLLYGTASGGGTNDYGVVFRLAKDGSGFQSLFRFAGTNGANPEGGLLEGSDGRLYGTATAGNLVSSSVSSKLAGTVFGLDKSGANFVVVRAFWQVTVPGQASALQTNGYAPYGRLVEGSDGRLYGTTCFGGVNGNGTVYGVGKDGTGFQVLHAFGTSTTTDGRMPLAELLQASDGFLYGTTSDGGVAKSGILFRIGQDGNNYSVLATLNTTGGPAAALMEGTDGGLYGTTQSGGAYGAGALFKLQKDGSGFTLLTSFSPTGGDGQSPYAPLTQASDGRLYGTTRQGGNQSVGSIFSLCLDGRGYQQVSGLNGSGTGSASPMAGVVEATNGLLYGTTQSGGATGNGTLFRLPKDGTAFNVFYSPPTSGSGKEPRATLLQASDGVLYGTTVLGGNSSAGTLFRVNPNGLDYGVLTHFTTALSGGGAHPVQGVIEGSDHLLYGTTYDGGPAGNGTLFKVDRYGSGYTVLKGFTDAVTQGANPAAPLLEAKDGLLYGTTYGGGATNNAGTVFRIAKDGSGFQVLHSFNGTGGDARHPCGKLVQGTEGMLYGTTERGGATNDAGALFTLNTNGTGYAVLASFGGALGAYPRGGLSVGPDGAFYGTTEQGGSLGLGTVFRYGPPIEEIAEFQLAAGVPTLTCLGAAGTNYCFERSGSLGPMAAWSPLCSTNAPGNGQFSVRDESPLPGGAFYRMRR